MDQRLSRERFRAASAFVENEGRALDRALIAHRLGEGSAKAVLAALQEYQNPDGGFGNGLEPDTPSPASSAIATSIGLRLLVRVGAGGDHPMATGAVGWLAARLDAERGVWPIIDAGVDEAPHAPWWSYSDDLASAWNGFRYNPTAEILALLYAYRGAVPTGAFEAAEAGVRRTLAEGALIQGAYDLKCAARLAEAAGAPTDIAGPLTDLIRRSLAGHDAADEHVAPYEIAPRPETVLADAVADRIGAALDKLIASQGEDGGWTPFWDWSFVDEAAWAGARVAWRGWLTREALETLLAWDRVDRA